MSSCHSLTWEILPLYIPLSRHCTLSLHLSLLFQPKFHAFACANKLHKAKMYKPGEAIRTSRTSRTCIRSHLLRDRRISRTCIHVPARLSISKYCVIHTPAHKAFLFFILLRVLPIQHIDISQYNLGHPYHPVEASRFLG